MQRVLWKISAVVMIGTAAVTAVPAQGPPGGFGGSGGPDPSMIFRFMDRNGDGRLDRDEIDNSRGPMRDRMRELRIDYSRGLSQDDFVRVMERSRSESGRGGDYGRGGDNGRGDPRNGDQGRDFSGRGGDDRGGDSRGDYRGDYRDGDYRGGDSGRGGDSRSSGSRGGTPEPPPKPRVTIDLQQTFREGDKDFDGQLGLYEWRQWKGRVADAEFHRLDLNGDGFVTPYEIQRSTTAPAVVVAANGTPVATPPNGAAPAAAARPNGTPANATPATGTPANTAAPTAPAAAGTPKLLTAADLNLDRIVIDENNQKVRQYRSQFTLLDRDGDKLITAEEWQNSRVLRERLNKAQVDLNQTMDADTFVRHFVRLDQLEQSTGA